MALFPYPIIDVHTHIRAPDETGALVARGARFGIARFGVSAVFVGGPDPTPEQCREANDCVLAARDRHPEAVLPFCYVNPRHTEAALAELERCVAGHGMVGVKLWIALPASDVRVATVARRAAELGVPVLQHSWYKRVGHAECESTPADVAVLAARVPAATIIMAHLFGGGQRGLADIAPHPNVLADVSGGEPEAGRLEEAVAALGAGRIVFGSDAFGRSYATQLAKVVGARIDDDARRQILWDNAQRLFGRGGAS